MVKILHTADIHLGAKFSILGNKGIQQREQIKNTFKKITSTAISERVNIVLIAGDLFDSNSQPQGNIGLVVEQFNLLGENKIPVCLIPGNHDPFDSSSIYRKVNFEQICPNVKVFTEAEISYKEYPELDLTVYGKPLTEKIKEIKSEKDLTVIVGGEKVPPEVYKLSDWNISVTTQPHSEIAALAIFLDRYFNGGEFKSKFSKAKLRVIPQERGKKVLKL